MWRLLEAVPARATVHRVLVRNGLVAAEEQQHPRKYRRWQREAPMHLWQLDLVGGIPLADGRECSIHLVLDGHVLRTVSSRLRRADLKFHTVQCDAGYGPGRARVNVRSQDMLDRLLSGHA